MNDARARHLPEQPNRSIVIERTLYNNFAAGVSLTGDRYFNACSLEFDGKYRFNLGWLSHISYGRTGVPQKWQFGQGKAEIVQIIKRITLFVLNHLR
ncbi:MAG TPA: hypothetical protein VEC99_07790 [Clostridia bacterium]|nr:hypothetical protein [Clostridia bacterium]